MSIFDEIPHTKQGLISYGNYAENELKEIELRRKRMEKILEEIHRRLEAMKGKDNA
jgi:hypothetical protein